MALFVMFATWWRGLGFLAPLQAFAGFFLRGHAVDARWWAALLGAGVHGAVSVALGILLTAVAFRRSGAVE